MYVCMPAYIPTSISLSLSVALWLCVSDVACFLLPQLLPIVALSNSRQEANFQDWHRAPETGLLLSTLTQVTIIGIYST